MTSNSSNDGTPGASSTQQDKENPKGKGLATGDTDQDATTQVDQDSVISRLGQSAAGLSRSVFQGTPAANDLANVATSGKPGAASSSNKPVAWAESSSAAAGLSSANSGSFRSTQADAHVAAEEAAFSDFLDNTSVLVHTEPVGFEKSWQAATSSVPKSTGYGPPRDLTLSSVGEQEERDGMDVVHLLSQADEQLPENDEDIKISEPELRSLRQALFEDGTAQISASDWNNILNFVPDFLRGEDGRVDPVESSHMQLGVVDNAEAGELWLQEWNRVLTSYADEVWGDLGDLVREARAEVEQVKTGQEGQRTDPRALRQLRSILTHVRARL